MNKCIASHAPRTVAHCNVIENLASGPDATCAWAGINTFLLYTSVIARAFRVEDAFWTTSVVRVALIFGNAHALAFSRADCIAPTGTGIARISGFFIGSRRCINRRSVDVLKVESFHPIAYVVQAGKPQRHPQRSRAGKHS